MDDLKRYDSQGDGSMYRRLDGDWVRHDEAVDALEAKDAEIARKDAAIQALLSLFPPINCHDQRGDIVVVIPVGELATLRAALNGKE